MKISFLRFFGLLILFKIMLLSIYTYYVIDKYLIWDPIDIAKYEEEQNSDNFQYPIAELIKSIIDSNVDNNRGSVASAVVMSDILNTYFEFYKSFNQLDKRFVSLGVYQTYKVWDQDAALEWINGYSSIPLDEKGKFNFLKKYPYASILSNRLTENTKKLKNKVNFIRENTLEPPDKTDIWTRTYKLKDVDEGMGSLPFSTDNITVPKVPPYPTPESPLFLLDKTHFEIVSQNNTEKQKRNAVYWQGTGNFEKTPDMGGVSPSGFWQIILISEKSKTLNEKDFIKTASDLAKVTTDAAIASWKIKYRDWRQRPSTMFGKNSFYTLGNPPFPSYVSGHATIAAAAASWLDSQFPNDKNIFYKIGRDMFNSRLWGGVHVLSDNDAGWSLGQRIAKQYSDDVEVIDWFSSYFPLLDSKILSYYQKIDNFIKTQKRNKSIRDLNLPIFEEVENHGIAMPPLDILNPHEVTSGSLAMIDLNQDNKQDILISGRDMASLFLSSGSHKFKYEKEWEKEYTGLSGAYFTYDINREITGILLVGEREPKWYTFENGKFSQESQIDINLDVDFHTRGILIDDINSDMINDIILFNYSNTWFENGSPSFGIEGSQNHILYGTVDGFEFSPYSHSIKAPSFVGTKVDLNNDGIMETVEILDERKPRIIDGQTGQLMKLNEIINKPIAGMSATPIIVNKEVALHISNIRLAEELDATTPYQDIPRVQNDVLLKWSPENNEFVDISNSLLNDYKREWSWGSAAGDINGDGLQDLVVAEGIIDSLAFNCGIRIYIQQKDGSFLSVSDLIGINFTEGSPRSIALEDLDDDGDLDIIVNSKLQARIFENKSDIIPKNNIPLSVSPERGYLTQVIE